ncbi:hypothetical protein CYY_005932 [Polysphondylium violaceum]|uniref:UBL3-like ubiquitin domain-containing protein n=1 Tax=Polysphondylium violaceum TaxID=133409 RepID=A0A8J4PUW2_9MYCE|nr:hypothetical protein CYY_005932 [Polysphondylium violaceum]
MSNTVDRNKVSVRFIIDKSHQYVVLLDRSTTFKQIEHQLLETKPNDLFSPTIASNLDDYQLKFIYSGKIFNYQSTVADLEKTQSKYPLNVQLIHLKKSNNNNNSSNSSNSSNSNSSQEEETFHAHGCFFDIDEFQQIEQIFNSKENHDNHTVDLSFLNNFLHSYWTFLISRHPTLLENSPSFNSNRNVPSSSSSSTTNTPTETVNTNTNTNTNTNNNNSSRPFPTEKLSKILRTVLKVNSLDAHTRINKEQFRIIFYLFTTESDNHACPSGSIESVKRMIQQYHVTLDTDHPFDNEMFNTIYSTVENLQTRNENQQQQPLTCQNIELLFYLYTAHVFIQRDKHLETNQDQQHNQHQPSSSGTPSS